MHTEYHFFSLQFDLLLVARKSFWAEWLPSVLTAFSQAVWRYRYGTTPNSVFIVAYGLRKLMFWLLAFGFWLVCQCNIDPDPVSSLDSLLISFDHLTVSI